MNLNYHKVKQNNLVDYSLAWQDHFFLLCLDKGKRTNGAVCMARRQFKNLQLIMKYMKENPCSCPKLPYNENLVTSTVQ